MKKKYEGRSSNVDVRLSARHVLQIFWQHSASGRETNYLSDFRRTIPVRAIR